MRPEIKALIFIIIVVALALFFAIKNGTIKNDKQGKNKS